LTGVAHLHVHPVFHELLDAVAVKCHGGHYQLVHSLLERLDVEVALTSAHALIGDAHVLEFRVEYFAGWVEVHELPETAFKTHFIH
jgi:hypothetical protein